MAIKLADTTRPNNYVDSEHLGTFPVAYAEDIWFEDGTRLSEKTFDGESIQKTELPIASATTEGKIYQFVGETGTYINGCFYKCVETSVNNYTWKLINVIDNPVRSIDDDIYSHFNEYDEGAVIVYTGEDTPSYQKGHHYKKVIRGSVPTYYVDVYQDSEHQTTTPYQSLEPVVEVGTVLFYTDYNSGFVPQCKCIAISGDEYTWYRYNDGLTMRSSYGVHVSTNTTSNLLSYWEDIGGGGGGSSEFIGTQAEWDALSSGQKAKYEIVNITDDTVSETVVDSVTPNDMNPVTSNAVSECTGYIDTMLMVGGEFDTTYQDGSSSQQYNVTTGLYRVHVYLYNPTNEKTSNRCLIQRYENGTAKATLFDFNYTGSGAIQQQNYIRVKSGTIGVTHEAAGGNVGGRCYFTLHKVNESH